MTTPEFLRELAGIAAEFDWKLVADTSHYADRRSRLRLHLLATPAADRSVKLAPLQALCYSLTAQALSPERWMDAAEALELSVQEAAEIVAASTDRTWTGREGDRAPSETLVSLRRHLLETVGLIASVPVS
jgi:hypothetical protein